MVWSLTVGSALITGGFVVEPGVDRVGEAWAGDTCDNDVVLICGVCTGWWGTALVMLDGAGLCSAFSLRILLVLASSPSVLTPGVAYESGVRLRF